MITGEQANSEQATQTNIDNTKAPWLAWAIFVGLLVLLAVTWGKEPLSYLLS